jgi:hypothetical protein
MLDSLFEFYFKGIGILWNIIFLWTALGLQNMWHILELTCGSKNSRSLVLRK